MNATPYAVNKVPCGFSGLSATLEPGESATVYTLVGHVNDIGKINKRSKDLCSPAYILRKREEASALTRELTEDVATKTDHHYLMNIAVSPIWTIFCGADIRSCSITGRKGPLSIYTPASMGIWSGIITSFLLRRSTTHRGTAISGI